MSTFELWVSGLPGCARCRVPRGAAIRGSRRGRQRFAILLNWLLLLPVVANVAVAQGVAGAQVGGLPSPALGQTTGIDRLHIERALRLLEGRLNDDDLSYLVTSEAKASALVAWLEEIDCTQGPIADFDGPKLGQALAKRLERIEITRKQAFALVDQCRLPGKERRALDAAEALGRAWARYSMETAEGKDATHDGDALGAMWSKLRGNAEWQTLCRRGRSSKEDDSDIDSDEARWRPLSEALKPACGEVLGEDDRMRALLDLGSAHTRATALCFDRSLTTPEEAPPVAQQSDGGTSDDGMSQVAVPKGPSQLALEWTRFQPLASSPDPDQLRQRYADFQGWLRGRYLESRELLQSLPGQLEGAPSLDAWRQQGERLIGLLQGDGPLPLGDPALARDPRWMALLWLQGDALSHGGRRLGLYVEGLQDGPRQDFEERIGKILAAADLAPDIAAGIAADATAGAAVVDLGAGTTAAGALPWALLSPEQLAALSQSFDGLWRLWRRAEAWRQGFPLGPVPDRGWYLWVAHDGAPISGETAALAHDAPLRWRVELRRPPEIRQSPETEELLGEQLDSGLRFVVPRPRMDPQVPRGDYVEHLGQALVTSLAGSTAQLEDPAAWRAMAQRLGFDGRWLASAGGLQGDGWGALHLEILGSCLQVQVLAKAAPSSGCRLVGGVDDPDLGSKLAAAARQIAAEALVERADELAQRAVAALQAVFDDAQTTVQGWPSPLPSEIQLRQGTVIWRPRAADLPPPLTGAAVEIRLRGIDGGAEPLLEVDVTPPLGAWLQRLDASGSLSALGPAMAANGGWRLDVQVDGLGRLGYGRLDGQGLRIEDPDTLLMPGGVTLRCSEILWSTAQGLQLRGAELNLPFGQQWGLSVEVQRRDDGGWRFELDAAGNERLRAWAESKLHQLGALPVEVSVERLGLSSDGLDIALAVDDVVLRQELEQRLAESGWLEQIETLEALPQSLAAQAKALQDKALQDKAQEAVDGAETALTTEATAAIAGTVDAVCQARDQALADVASGIGAVTEQPDPCDVENLGPWSFGLRFDGLGSPAPRLRGLLLDPQTGLDHRQATFDAGGLKDHLQGQWNGSWVTVATAAPTVDDRGVGLELQLSIDLGLGGDRVAVRLPLLLAWSGGLQAQDVDRTLRQAADQALLQAFDRLILPRTFEGGDVLVTLQRGCRFDGRGRLVLKGRSQISEDPLIEVPFEARVPLRGGQLELTSDIDLKNEVLRHLGTWLGQVQLPQPPGDAFTLRQLELIDRHGQSVLSGSNELPVGLRVAANVGIWGEGMRLILPPLRIEPRGVTVESDGGIGLVVNTDPLFVGPFSLHEVGGTLSQRFLEIEAKISFAGLKPIFFVHGLFTLDLKYPARFSLDGRAVLFSVLEVGRSTTQVNLEPPFHFSTELSIGGALSSIILIEVKVLLDGEAQTLSGSGRVEVFRIPLASGSFRLDYGNQQITAVGEFDVGILKGDAELETREAFRDARLRADLKAFALGGFSLGGLRLRVVPRSASLTLTVLGIDLTLVVPTPQELTPDKILELILSALVPDLDLQAMIEAILDGNLQINPFGSFGPGGGEASGGDGGKGGDDDGDDDNGDDDDDDDGEKGDGEVLGEGGDFSLPPGKNPGSDVIECTAPECTVPKCTAPDCSAPVTEDLVDDKPDPPPSQPGGGIVGDLDPPGTVCYELEMEGALLALVASESGKAPQRVTLVHGKDRPGFSEHFTCDAQGNCRGTGKRLMVTGGRYVQALAADDAADQLTDTPCAPSDQSRVVFYQGDSEATLRLATWNPASVGICASDLAKLDGESLQQPRWRLFVEILNGVGMPDLAVPGAANSRLPTPLPPPGSGAAARMDLARPFLLSDHVPPVVGFRPSPGLPHRVVFLQDEQPSVGHLWGLAGLRAEASETDLRRFLSWWRGAELPTSRLWLRDGLRLAQTVGAARAPVDLAIDLGDSWRGLGPVAESDLQELFGDGPEATRRRGDLLHGGRDFLRQHPEASLWGAGRAGVFLVDSQHLWAALPVSCVPAGSTIFELTGLVDLVSDWYQVDSKAFGRACPRVVPPEACLRDLVSLYFQQRRSGGLASGHLDVGQGLLCR